MLLGVGTVACTSVLGIAVAFLLVRYDFRGPRPLQLPHADPDHLAAAGGRAGLHLHPGPRRARSTCCCRTGSTCSGPINFVYGVHGVLLVETLHLFPMITLNVVDALGKIDPALEEAAESVGARGWRKLWHDHAAAHHAGLRGGRAAGVHLDLLRLRHAARAGRAGPPGPAGLPQHRAVRGPAPLPHGHRDLRADGAARDPLPAGRAALRGHQGLLVAVLLADRAAAPVARSAGGWSIALPVARAAAVVHPLHRRGAGLGGQGLVADAAAAWPTRCSTSSA